MAPAARTGETPTDRVLPVSSGAAGNSSCALSPLETLESLCLDCLLSLLDFRDFCNLSLVSSSLRAALLTDLSRQARCVSGLVLHCLCDTPVFPPLGELSFEGTLSSAGHAPSGRNVSVSTEARKERTCQGTSARPTPSRRCVERSSELDSDLVSPAEPGLPLGGGAPLVSRSASKQLPCRRKAPPFPLGLKPWKAAALVSKRLFSLRVGVDAFAAMPLPLWETLLRANAATLREVSLCSPLRWTSQRQQQHRQREVLEFLCSLQSSAHVQGGSEALYAPHPPLSPRFFSFGDRCSERLPPPARKASDEREASGSLDGAAPAARRGVAAASSLIPLCELKKLAIAAGPCSGVLELLGRCACRKCEELQLVVADMLTAAGWGESVDRVVARAGEGRRLRRFRLVVAPRGFFQERRLASWLQPPAEPRAPADESPAAAEPEPKIHPTSWLAALEEFSVDTDDPWILPKAAQLIAAVTRHPAETAGLLVGARLLGRDAPINQRRGADSRPGQDALRHSRESSAGSAEPGSCSRRGNGLACASGCGRCISAPEGEGLRADQPAAAERGGVRSGVRGDSSLERAEVTDSGASYLHTLCAPSEVDPAHHCATDMAVCLRAACLGEDNDPQPACRVEHRASRPSAASGDGGASHSEKHSAQGRYLTQPGDAASGADPFSVSPTPRFPSLRCCSFRCGSTPASGAGCFSWEAVESLLAAALPGCSLRFYGDILFSTCPHTDSPGALSPVSAFCRSSQRKKICSKGAGNITTGSARTEPLQRDASCDAQGICPVLAKASRGLETPGGGPWGGVCPFLLTAATSAPRPAASRGGVLPRHRLSSVCVLPQVVLKGAALVLQERGSSGVSMAALGRSSFRAPLRLGCFCAAAPLAAKNARVRDARSVRNNETPSRCDGRDAVGNPGVVCREARFQAFVELASIPLMRSSHLPEASDRCADRRDLGARLWLKQDAGRSLECALTAKDFRRPRANAGQDIQGRALAASAQRLERPSPLLPAVQVQLPSSVASGCPASFSSPADAPEGKSADARACVHICRQAAGEESSCDATSGSTEGGTERAAEVADERQIGLVRLGRLRRWRVWSSQYLRGLLGELPGFLLCLPPVEACANAAAHSCGETALAAHAAQGGERTGAQRPRAEGETRARAERGSGVGDRDAHQVQGMRATGANCRPKCCCQPGHPGASEGLDAVDRRCVFTLHRTREGGSEFTGERERGAPVRLDHRTASGEESAEEEDRILRRLTQAQEGASCFALGEAGGNEADTTALLLALCLDPGLRQGFQGIAMDCVFADCKEPVCRTKLPLESGSSGLLSVGISEACLPSLRALLWKLPASLRPTLQVVRLFVDPVEREDTGSVHSPLFTAQPRQERVPPGLCGLGAPAETSGSMGGGTTRTPRCSEGSAKHGAIGGCLNAECSAGPPAMSAELDLTANSSSAGRRSGLGAVRGVPGGTAEAVREFWAHAAESAQPQRQTELLPRGIQGEATGRLARDGQADAEMGGCASAVPAPCFAVDGRGEGNLRRFLLELLAVYTSVTRVEVRILRGDPGTNFSAWNVEEASWTSEDECCSCLLSQSARLCALHAVLLSLQFELVAVRRAQYVFETFMTYETRA